MLFKLELIINKILLDLIPKTEKNVKKGNKIFGGIILDKKNYSTVVTGVNNELINPLFHGEISTINNFFKIKKKINPKDCIFISSHEPCSLCLSAITWSGFDNFIYLYPYEDTNLKFQIPHDLKILDQVFKVKKGQYNNNNYYWKSYSIIKEISKLSKKKQNFLNNKITIINEKYKELSEIYQKNKKNNKIPLN